MKIKHRLFVSNILMIVIPLVVSLAVFYAGLYVFTTVTGIRDNRGIREGRAFFESQMQMTDLAGKWRKESADIGEIARDVSAFNTSRAEQNDGWPQLLIYRGDELLVPNEMPAYDTSLARALREHGNVTVFGGMIAHAEHVGEYRAILIDAGTRVRGETIGYREVMRYGTMLAVVCSIFVILATNRFLTRFVFRSIVGSLDTLSGGVRQIRDGNLGYRIDYRGDDEFAAVCDDFNEMASRLGASVEARARDEISRRELIAGISHDLRTPLTSIKAYVEGLQKGIAPTPEATARYLATIQSKTNDLEHIIDMLFLFTKLDTGTFPYRIERVHLADEVAETIDALAGEYRDKKKKVRLSFANDAPDTWVDVDIVQLRNVLINLASNSAKYGDKETTEIAVRVTASGGRATIAVADNGPGVPEEALEKIFDIFYRGDPARRDPSKGSGLGLAIASKIVSHFGGTIHAENQPGGGLCVTITLPIKAR